LVLRCLFIVFDCTSGIVVVLGLNIIGPRAFAVLFGSLCQGKTPVDIALKCNLNIARKYQSLGGKEATLNPGPQEGRWYWRKSTWREASSVRR
jgi:hypothetical protein